ncbi:MAG: energy transducer TonB [Candidatus Krumholzibacteria bacterium]|nr:energy transducer TonB [Candidatus Krumholzibacteria bacterium]
MSIVIQTSANKAFKAKYPRYVRNALLGAVVFHVLVFVLSPPFTFKPYRLKEEQFEVIDVPDNIEIPPPPKEIAMPQVPVEAADDEDADTEDLPETTFDDFDEMPPPPPPGGGDQGVFLAFDEPPTLKHFEVPVYPELAREAGIEGTVRVKVLVMEDGKVSSVSVVSSDVTPAMEKAALAAAKKCRFNPAKQRTTPVKAHVMIPFHFRLN